MNTLSRLGGALALTAGAALTLGSGVASAQTQFTGYTDGCFGIACTPTPSVTPESVVLAGLTFTSSVFNGMSSGGFLAIGSQAGTPNVDNLGSFSLTGSPFLYTGQAFDLLVSFTAPAGTTPGSVLVTSTLQGNVSSTDNGGVRINFDNGDKAFTFGSGATAGSFTFSVNDVSLIAGGLPVAVTGQITTQVSAIPEPETYALMMAGLAAVGFMSRRRKKA